MSAISPADAAGGESGAGSLEVVLTMPALILLITAVVQFALWSHGRHVALAAAQEAAEMARIDGGSADLGRQRAVDSIAQAAPRLLIGPEVDVWRGAESAGATVRGAVPSLIPGVTLSVSGRAGGPVESFRRPA